MKQIFSAIFFMHFFCINVVGQEKRTRNYWLCGIGSDIQIIIQQPTVDYPPRVNFENVSYKQTATMGYYMDINYVFIIHKSFFLQTGINYITRKTHIIYNSDSAIKYASPNNPTPVIERWITYHNIEFPVLLGVRFGEVQIGAGVKYIVLTTVVEQAEDLVGSKSEIKYSITKLPHYPVPTLFFRYNLNKPGNLKANINIDLRSMYQLDIGLGISYAFNIMK